MGGTVRLVGGAECVLPGLVPKLREASFQIEADPAAAPAALLVTLAQAPAFGADPLAIAAAEAFATPEGGDRLLINIWHAPVTHDWAASRHAAAMAAFTRYAALAWASRHVRVNGLTIAAGPATACVPDDDVIATILALWRWPSMTGQIIHLGG